MPDHAIRLDFETWNKIDDHEKQEAASAKLRAELQPTLAALDVHPRSPSYLAYYRLTPKACTTLTTLLTDLEKRKRAKLGTVHIYEWADEDDNADADWYLLEPVAEFDLDGRKDGITRVKGDRFKGREQLRTYSNNLFVTQSALDALRTAKLGAFDAFWVADTGKYAATQWYHLVPTAFVGRGVDHPWFDVATRGQFKLDGFEEVEPTTDPWRRGVNLFEIRQLRKDAPDTGRELRALLNLLRATPIIDYKYSYNFVRTPMRLLRSALPKNADIAYAWAAKPPEEGGRDPARFSRVCVSRKACKFLLDRRLARSSDFQPLILLDKPPAGAQVFDGPLPVPPIYAPSVVATMRAAEAKLRAKHDANPKPPAPVKPVPLKPLLAKLKKEIKNRSGEPAAPGATPAQIAAATKAAGVKKLPARWAELLAEVDGFVLDQCALYDGDAALRAEPTATLAESHRSIVSTLRHARPDLPKGYLNVADSDFGDPLFLDTDHESNGDCPVIWIDHETSETVQTWPSITLFLKDALDPAPED